MLETSELNEKNVGLLCMFGKKHTRNASKPTKEPTIFNSQLRSKLHCKGSFHILDNLSCTRVRVTYEQQYDSPRLQAPSQI
jgi:hypothetical protein